MADFSNPESLPTHADSQPDLVVTAGPRGAGLSARAAGHWFASKLGRPGQVALLMQKAGGLKAEELANAKWDISDALLDHIGAQFLWKLWAHRRPAQLVLGPRHEDFFRRLESLGSAHFAPVAKPSRLGWITAVGQSTLNFYDHARDFIAMLGQLVLDVGHLVRRPRRGPWREISANIFHCGTEALGITALVGFLIGVVLSYLSAQQLRLFGANIFIVNILGMSIIRELGPMLAAILVAGRSGSAITAQLGVMRVTEELDALLVMGIPHGYRLIMPRVVALAIAMPLLVLWTDTLALVGGVAAANISLGLSPEYFLETLPKVVPRANILIGAGKGVVFGTLIALTACHFGLRIAPNTASLGRGTTDSVVSAITIVILADAVFAITLKSVGI